MKDNLFNTITLHKLIRKICNGSTYVVVEDVIRNAMECMHVVMLLKGDDFDSLPKYLEAAQQKYKCFEQTECEFATEQIRDKYLEELLKHREDNTLLFKQLIRWKDAAKDGSEDENIKVGRKALNEVFRARIYMRKIGS